MSIKNSHTNADGSIWNFEYFDCDDFSILDKEKCTQCYAVCFVEDENGKIIIVHNGKKDTWGLIGGTIEKGEDHENTLKREIHEEGNIEVLKYLPIGYQKASGEDLENYSYQLRYVVLGRKFGEFEKDLGGGSVDKVKFIDIDEVKEYFNWGEVGDRIIARAKELKKDLTKS